jgi:hypothetical protein
LRSPALLLECVRLCLVELWGLSSEEWQARGRISEAAVGFDGRETSRRIVCSQESRYRFLVWTFTWGLDDRRVEVGRVTEDESRSSHVPEGWVPECLGRLSANHDAKTWGRI